MSRFSEEESKNIHFVNLGVDNLHSSQEYSQLLTSFWFWQQVRRLFNNPNWNRTLKGRE